MNIIYARNETRTIIVLTTRLSRRVCINALKRSHCFEYEMRNENRVIFLFFNSVEKVARKITRSVSVSNSLYLFDSHIIHNNII